MAPTQSSNAGSGEKPSPYAGRWVARLRGRIIAQGGTPGQARSAAQDNRFKEKPEIIYMPTASPLTFSPLLDSVRTILPDDLPVYLVGGAVRDALLNRSSHDLDFALPSGGIKIARRVADALKADFYPLDEERDTGRVIITSQIAAPFILDFASFRGPDLESDLRGRDFTINALAVDVRTLSIFDPLGGAADLRAGCIRLCSESAFSDDPIRILRAIRQAAIFGFHILPQTRQAMKRAVPLLSVVSSERIRDELVRILEGSRPSVSLRALDLLGVLNHILPELSALKGVEQPTPHVQDVWAHTLSTVRYLEGILSALAPEYDPEKGADLFNGLLVIQLGRYREQLEKHLSAQLVPGRSMRALLFLATLYHDIAKPASRMVDELNRLRFLGHDELGAGVAAGRLQALQFSSAEIERLETIVRNHMRIHFHTDRLLSAGKPPTRRGIYRFFRDTAEAGVDVCLLTLADLRATYAETLPQEVWSSCLAVCRTFLENWWEKPAESISPPPLVDGKVLMHELAIPPGPQVGRLLESIREAQAQGKVQSRLDALIFARQTLSDMGRGELMEILSVNGNRLAFFQRPGTGTPLVMLHGFPFDHTLWRALIPLLPPESWLILPDLRGHGQSDSPQGIYRMSDLADDLAAILGYLRVKKAILVGHSLGGYVALAFARSYPQRLAGLGLVSSRADADTPERRLSRYKLAEKVQEQGVSALEDALLSRLTSNPDLISSLRDLILKVTPAAAIATLQGMAERPDSSSLLTALDIPMLAVAGVDDQLLPLEQACSLAAISPRLRWFEIPGAGHLPMLESPASTAEAIRFLLGQ